MTVLVVPGGSTRQESVTNALAVADARFDFVAIHDGARPLIDTEDIIAVFDAAFSCGAAALGVPVKDTVRSFREILDGKYDDLPEAAFLSVGTIEDVVKKAETL